MVRLLFSARYFLDLHDREKKPQDKTHEDNPDIDQSIEYRVQSIAYRFGSVLYKWNVECNWHKGWTL